MTFGAGQGPPAGIFMPRRWGRGRGHEGSRIHRDGGPGPGVGSHGFGGYGDHVLFSFMVGFL